MRSLLLATALLAACGDDPPKVERDPNPAQASDSGSRSDAATPVLDASGLPIGQGDGAVLESDANAPDARGTPDVVPYPACGGIAGLRCPDGEFCNQETPPEGLGCGWEDSLGTCVSRSETCDQPERVCGCDGETYESPCAAHAAGSSVKTRGPCKADRELNCDERDVICKRSRPSCGNDQVPAVVEGCWGECVTLSECVCHAADECPQREQYVCHMNRQRCGPYVN
ncbi:MAG: hypothetical protein ABW352_18955 [Polyangiales bacterium]